MNEAMLREYIPWLCYAMEQYHLEVFVFTQVFIGMKTFTVFCNAFLSLNSCLVNIHISYNLRTQVNLDWIDFLDLDPK